jgi:hypothetical protein
MLDLLSDLEEEGTNFLRNFREILTNYKDLHPIRQA